MISLFDGDGDGALLPTDLELVLQHTGLWDPSEPSDASPYSGSESGGDPQWRPGDCAPCQ
jgi:hypothetical protein